MALQERGDLPGATSLLRDVIFGTFEHAARGQAAAGCPIAVRQTGTAILDLLLRSANPAVDTSTRLNLVETKLDRILKRLD